MVPHQRSRPVDDFHTFCCNIDLQIKTKSKLNDETRGKFSSLRGGSGN
jgi:hypothetical protein